MFSLAAIALLSFGAEGAYLRYLKTSGDWRRVRQDAELSRRWDTWVYMPWRHQWTIGTGDRGGKFCREAGINGGFLDRGDVRALPWLEKFNLRFYMDHAAGKGDLYLRRGDAARLKRALSSTGVRPVSLDSALLAKLKGAVQGNLSRVRNSPVRVAYALDDEPSWGSFVRPAMWRVNADARAYAEWLNGIYGGAPPHGPQYVTADSAKQFYPRPFGEWDLSPFCDQLSYNDSVWCNLLGELVEHANSVDPETPCGLVGCQSPNAFGGYDYQKLMKKLQFIEAYDLGLSQAVVRSFNPGSIPQVTTHFKKGTSVGGDVWQVWYFLSHGNRGMIGWVEGWFGSGARPKPWLAQFAPTLKEVSERIAPKVVGGEWLHDGVAIYYSQASLQVGWILDVESHAGTWVNRNNDHKLGTTHLTRAAWDLMLRDEGLQYSFVGYRDVAVDGVPKEYKALILPACYALSDAEAAAIRAFAERGGTVIADFCCGLFGQHGRGRKKGALDDLFGVAHDGSTGRGNLFGGKLLVETDQDKGYSYKTFNQLFSTVSCRLDGGFAVAELKLPTRTLREIGRGRAVYMNLSPQRYLAHRDDRSIAGERRRVFTEHLLAAGLKPRATVVGANGTRPFKAELTFWRKNGRVFLFLVQSASMGGSELGGGSAKGLVPGTEAVKITLPEGARDVVDERSGDKLGDAREVVRNWNRAEAVVLSYVEAEPSRAKTPARAPGAARLRPHSPEAEAEEEEPAREPPTLDEQLQKLVARLLKRARRYAARGEPEKARAAYEQVIGLAPTSREAKEAREALKVLKEEN